MRWFKIKKFHGSIINRKIKSFYIWNKLLQTKNVNLAIKLFAHHISDKRLIYVINEENRARDIK